MRYFILLFVPRFCCVCYTHCAVLSRFSPVQLFATLWTVAQQAPLSMGFSRQEYWSGLPFPSLWNLPDQSCFRLKASPTMFSGQKGVETEGEALCREISRVRGDADPEDADFSPQELSAHTVTFTEGAGWPPLITVGVSSAAANTSSQGTIPS